jgi:hypothetical protein
MPRLPPSHGGAGFTSFGSHFLNFALTLAEYYGKEPILDKKYEAIMNNTINIAIIIIIEEKMKLP